MTDGRDILQVHHGCQMLSLISAAGCTVTALIAAFLAAAENATAQHRMQAAVNALVTFGQAKSLDLSSAIATESKQSSQNLAVLNTTLQEN